MIEDNELDQLIMDKMIKHYDLFHHIETSVDARSAINKIEKHQFDDNNLPDLIFLDLSMPGFSGFDFLEKFKKLYKQINKNIDIFVITAYIDPNDLSKAQSFNFVKEIILKPVKSTVLAELYSSYKQAFTVDYR